MTNEIQMVLFLSTANISPATGELLDMQTDDVPTCYDKEGCGWWVYVPPAAFGEPGGTLQDPHTCPDDLVRVLAYARSVKCSWICFDCDVPPNENLPIWEW